MIVFLEYEIRVALCLICFWAIFFLFLRKSSRYRLGRISLLGSCALAFLLPAFPFTWQRQVLLMPEDVLNPSPGAAIPDVWMSVLSWTAAIGVMVAFLLFLARWIPLWKFSRQGSMVLTQTGQRVLLVSEDILPFCFFRTIVIGQKDFREGSPALVHESAHASMGHSWDILLADLLLSFQWFNPAAWLIRIHLRALHEYEADEYVLSTGVDVGIYGQLLLESARKRSRLQEVLYLDGGSIEDRIRRMSQRGKSSGWLRFCSLALALPLAVGVSVRIDSVYVAGYAVLDPVSVRSVISGGTRTRPDLDVLRQIEPGMPSAGSPPIFISSESGFSHWFADNVKYPATDEVGVVLAGFSVDRNGRMKDVSIVKGASASLDKAVLDALKAETTWAPSGEDGHSSAVRLVLPVIFSH